MSRNFGISIQRNNEKRFSIDDAFDEETDDMGAEDSHSQIRNHNMPNNLEGFRTYRLTHETSRDSDSLIQDGSLSDMSPTSNCFAHPKVRENWRMVLAAVMLLIIGIGLLIIGGMALFKPDSGLQGAVFLLAGFICFLPGAYHVVFIYMAARGHKGYSFHQLPLFT